MKKISKKRFNQLKKVVERKFPESYGLQQIHLSRLIIEEKTRGFSGKELIEYCRNIAKKFEEENYDK